MLERMKSKGNIASLLVGVQICTATLEISMQFLIKLGIKLPQDLAIPILGLYPKDFQSYHKDTCPTKFIAALFVIASTWKQAKCF